MSKPSRDPQHISNTAWYYEAPSSIVVVVEHRTAGGQWVATTQTRIFAAQLRRSLARMRKPARRGKR